MPLCAPVVGAALGAFSYRKLIGRHLPCDTCVEEEQQSPPLPPLNIKLRCNLTTGHRL
nr:Aquaglyceroporin [Klebsiella pneumoniae]